MEERAMRLTTVTIAIATILLLQGSILDQAEAIKPGDGQQEEIVGLDEVCLGSTTENTATIYSVPLNKKFILKDAIADLLAVGSTFGHIRAEREIDSVKSTVLILTTTVPQIHLEFGIDFPPGSNIIARGIGACIYISGNLILA
jgi:hypothetical protein